MSKPLLHIYSCRAECQTDVNLFELAAKDCGVDIAFTIRQNSFLEGMELPDVEMEFKSSVALKNLNKLLDSVPDSHVMQETLRPVNIHRNSLEREDRSINEAIFEPYFRALAQRAQLSRVAGKGQPGQHARSL